MSDRPQDIAPAVIPAAGAARGVAAIELALETMPLSPGVYRMLDAKGDALYVGKARALKRRVTSYTQIARLPERLRRMVSETATMEIITTHTEAEALLLEANLIKRLKPRFNIVLRDDKSYPWLMLTEDHAYPQIAKHRGARGRKASYYGPFASAWAVNQTVTAMQRVFLLRSCTDSVFANRSRPCLLHQIRRCSAPCVGRIGDEDYAALIAQAREFLSGKGSAVQKRLAAEMEQAAEALEFERAAAVRDRIRALTHVQGTDVINPASLTDADVIAALADCRADLRAGVLHPRRPQQRQPRLLPQPRPRRGHRRGARRLRRPVLRRQAAAAAAAAEPWRWPEQELIAEALTLKAGTFGGTRRVEVSVPQRGEKQAVVAHAETLNAREALERRLAETAGQAKLLDGVAALFALPAPPERIEVYDNSHIMGANAYGVLVAAGPEGFRKSAYRKYAIRGPITPGDDFAMMREVLERRFGRALREEARGWRAGTPHLARLVLIDGGAGQLSAVRGVLTDLGIADLPVVAIAKGPDRDAGREWFSPRGPHRFPAAAARPGAVLTCSACATRPTASPSPPTAPAARSRWSTSELDEVPGIGAARKRALLNHFGSARGVKQAGLQDLEAAPGISRETASRVYAHFHPGARVAGT